MKFVKLFFLVGLLASTASPALAMRSNGGRGGGDPCEEKFQGIARDLLAWIKGLGSRELSLPANLSNEDYSVRMSAQIQKAKVSCVASGDPGYPVQVDGVPKVCRFDVSADGGHITCDLKKFLSLSDSNQYVLVHHEYAGLANIEVSTGSVSDYSVSSQISDLLLDQVRRGLSVLPGYETELEVPPGMSLDKKVAWVVRNYLFNYCTYALSVADATLDKAEVTKVANESVSGYADDVRQIKIDLDLIFSSDDEKFVREQSLLLENTSGSYQIKDAVGVCDRTIRYN